jgi:hypothetical protein
MYQRNSLMKTFIFVKEGDAKPSVFRDLMETVNIRADSSDYDQQVGFYTHMNFNLRIGRNRTEESPKLPLALFHFTVDPTQSTQNADTFRVIDTDKMMSILDEGYDFVLFGFYSDDHLVVDYSVIKDAKYVVRDDKDVLIDYDTKQPISSNPSPNVSFITTLFGMIKMKPMPVYYLILDPNLVKISDGLDYTDEKNDITYRLDDKKHIKENFFTPDFGSTVTKIGNILITSADKFTIDLFGDSIYSHYATKGSVPKLDLTISSDLTVTSKNNKLNVQVTKPIGYVKYSILAGKFFNMVDSAEKLEFEFVVVKS